METFWATAKLEMEFLQGSFKDFTRSQMHTIIFD